MKILMALMGLDIGGAETHVAELSKALVQCGHTVLVASNGGAYEPELTQAGIRHVKIPLHRHDKMLRSLRLLEQLIRQEQPDLVHAHARIPAFLCGLLQKKLGFPLITSAHWVFAVTPLLRMITNWGDRTMAVSEDIRSYLMREYQVPADQIHVTINGINTGHFRDTAPDQALRTELGLLNGPVIGAVGRLDADRALTAELLIHITPRLLEQYPEAQILLVGGGTREAELREMADQVNASVHRSAIVMTGPRTDIPRLLPLITVFAGASRAVLEAMAAQRPVILSGNEGYLGALRPEVLSSAMETNFCFRGAALPDRETLLTEVLRVLALPEEARTAMGAYGRRVVTEHYSVERMIRDHLDAYDRLLHGPKPARAVISGYYGYENLGDDSILLSISRQLQHTEPPVRLTVLSRHPSGTRTCYGLPAAARFSPVQVLRSIRSCDLLISGGGTLLQDKTSARSLLYYLGVIRLAQRLGKPVFLWANGVGPVRHAIGRRWVRSCVESCTAVTLRDEDSLEELRAMGVTRQDISVTTDPAMTLEGDGQGRQRIAALGVPAQTPLIGVSLRKAEGIEKSYDAFAALCDRLARETGRQILFLIMQGSGDTQVCRQIQDRMTEPSFCIQTPGDPAAMLDVVGCLDALVSMRLHTILFAARQRVPVAGCVYDPKVAAFLKLLDMPSCGIPEAMDPEAAFQTVQAMLFSRDEYVERLDQRAAAMEAKSGDTAARLQEVLKQVL